MTEETSEQPTAEQPISLKDAQTRIEGFFATDPERYKLTRVLDDDYYVLIDGYKTESGQSLGEIRLQRMLAGDMTLFNNTNNNIDGAYELGKQLQILGIDVTSIGGHLYNLSPEEQEILNQYNADLKRDWDERIAETSG